jgi:hypothetical protein
LTPREPNTVICQRSHGLGGVPSGQKPTRCGDGQSFTGYLRNLEEGREAVGETCWTRFQFIEADITEANACEHAAKGVDHILHQAALGSVPRSLADPHVK